MTITVGKDTANTRKTLTIGDQSVAYYSISAAQDAGLGDFSKLPAALKVVLENLLRFEDDGFSVSVDDIKAFSAWADNGGKNPIEIAYRPARVLMQDFTGVPAVVDLAAMRDGIVALGGDAQQINPLNPVDLVIDHSVMIDEFGNPRAFQMNVDREYERNMERYQFLKWGQGAFDNFRGVPPGTGICHQVNLESRLCGLDCVTALTRFSRVHPTERYVRSHLQTTPDDLHLPVCRKPPVPPVPSARRPQSAS